jgi:hypothetical protein
MKNIARNVAKLGLVVFAALSLTHCQQALAGWTGIMNGAGIGWASVNVTSSTHQSNRVTTLNNTVSPSAAMAPATGYKATGNLPPGSATNTYARIIGLKGGIWQAALNSANSADGTDNAELESKVAITPADCASITFGSVINQTQSDLDANGFTGTISVNATATAGTALWLRGFEYTNCMADVPPDDPTTVENESIEYLKTHGVLRFESLMVGPFEFGGADNTTCPLIVPFTLSSGNLSNLVFATDAVAKSYPLAVDPANIYAYCGATVDYPPLNYYACGDVTVTYFPTNHSSFPLGTTPVAGTISDTNGNSINFTFTVTVLDIEAPDAPVLPDLTGQCSVQVPAPTATDSCTGTITGTTTDPTNYTSQGTYTVCWRFTDSSGNTTNANQTVIVKDTIPPVPPILLGLTNQCSVQVPRPTATDNCAGMVLGTTTDPTNYNNQGIYTVHWRFSDGNGNTNLANQTVVVKDTIPPVPPVLTSCSGTLCSPVTLTAPTAMDNCAGPVKGTTTTVFPITKCGTTVVTWTFNDGHGNTSTATQTVTVKNLDFDGFYSPISGTGGSFNSPQLVNVKCGNVFPIKFESKCGGDHYRSASPSIPKISIECYSSPTSHKPVSGGGNFRRVSSQGEDDWHFDWDTSRLSPGVYQLIATLQDGSTQTVFIKLK